MSNQQRRQKVVAQYSDLQKQIECVLPKPFPPPWTPLKRLQNTLCSMEPMVYDMEYSESEENSHRHKYAEKFFDLAKEAKKSIAEFNPDSGIHNQLGGIIESLKDLLQKYVREELDCVVPGEEDENELVNDIRFKLPANISSRPVLRNIYIILDHLKKEPKNRAQLLLLLNKVKLLLRFLYGDITNHLLICEADLREHFVNEDGLARLSRVDQEDEEKTKRWTWVKSWVKLIFCGIVIYLACPPETNISFLVFAVAAIFFIQAFNELNEGDSSNSTNSNDSQNFNRRKEFHIFLNFRGKYIRHNLAGHLHYHLEKAKIRTFLDIESVEKGEPYWEEIKMAISNSIGAITIFTENYGESEDSLEELVLIQNRAEELKGYKIRAIFLDVDPEDLTDPESKFYQGLQKHARDPRLVQWKEALANAKTLHGDVHNSESDNMPRRIVSIVEYFRKHVGRMEHPEPVRKRGRSQPAKGRRRQQSQPPRGRSR